ncbi:DNA polymerase delta small subunit [Thozetella sp. PMI_491]|nr:DNA polymerase delta small subunit [Thozetella sp. PMI_491]
MVALEDVEATLLQKPSGDAAEAPERKQAAYHPLKSFDLEKDRQYQQQFADMYFLRLTKIKPAVEAIADATWKDTVIGGERAKQVERVLDVRQGELCWVAGTIYIDMPLKPSILDDVAKDRWISAPSTVQKYFSEDDRDVVMMEDESGRVRLIGDALKSVILVTGCIIAVLGTENASGEFEVIDLKFPDLPPQPERWELSKPTNDVKQEPTGEDVEMSEGRQPGSGSKIAIVSGLEFSDSDASYAMELDLLLEFLLGEALGPSAQKELTHISRLIIAGNSIGPEHRPAQEEAGEKKFHKKYGYDSSSYNALPSQLLDEFMSEVLSTMPVTLLPGHLDPSNASYPQQPIHAAMFPKAKTYAALPGVASPGWLDCVTNPWEAEIEGWRVLGTSGQNIDDIFKYVDSDDRLGMMEATCRWRCSAPTAPDTLWTYPFQEDEPFVMRTCPHLYFVGCQPEFGTKIIQGPDGQMVRLVTVPSFVKTREILLVDAETLDISKVKISA